MTLQTCSVKNGFSKQHGSLAVLNLSFFTLFKIYFSLFKSFSGSVTQEGRSHCALFLIYRATYLLSSPTLYMFRF